MIYKWVQKGTIFQKNVAILEKVVKQLDFIKIK